MHWYSIYDISSIVAYFFLCIALGIWMIHYYTKNARLPVGVYLTLLYSYVILFFALALVTIDLAAGLFASHNDPTMPREELYLNVLWRVVYWSIQVLAWIVIPLCQAYPYSGEFTFLRKMAQAAWENIFFYLIVLVVAVVAGAGLAVAVIINNLKYPDNKVSVEMYVLFFKRLTM